MSSAKIAYFSMEIALESEIPTYSGGLGVLAGDFLRASADAPIPLVGVSLVHRRGYFRQRLEPNGRQTEAPDPWRPEERLERCAAWTNVSIEGRNVRVTAWRYGVRGVEGDETSVYLLDTDVAENSDWDRRLTDSLYGGDQRYRLCQEIVLGIGGERILRELGHDEIERFHMNEGHAGLLILSLLERRNRESPVPKTADVELEAVRSQCVFTTHTPVPAGHDRFPGSLVEQVLGERACRTLKRSGCFENDHLNMTYLALRGAGYVNGVAMQHGEVSRGMFPGYPIAAITNGVHATSWTSPPFAALFDEHMPAWREDQLYLRYVRGVPVSEVQAAHATAKKTLLQQVREKTGVSMDPAALTLGFARRAAVYKRADLLFHDTARLTWIARNKGPVQLVFAGRAHPADDPAKAMIGRVISAMKEIEGAIRTVYLENYDMTLARTICAGVDVWLNTPQRPQEASGTSGMKAALNGVPSLSILDGWWVEGHIEGITGWAIGGSGGLTEGREEEAAALYAKLESVVLPMFYGPPQEFGQVMRSTIAINGSFFTSSRMLQQYVSNAYFPDHTLHMLTRGRQPANAA